MYGQTKCLLLKSSYQKKLPMLEALTLEQSQIEWNQYLNLKVSCTMLSKIKIDNNKNVKVIKHERLKI